MGSIGTLRESDLHAALKRHYARPSDQIEAAVDGYVIDIVRRNELRGDELLEIQTHNFAALKRKLPQLLAAHRVRLIYPIAQAKWIARVKADGHTLIGRRKSPRRGALEDVFVELVSLPELMLHPNFTLEVVLIHEEEWRCLRVGRKRYRAREWRVCNRRLLNVIESIEFAAPSDFQRFIPDDLSAPFTSRELAEALQRPDYFAHKITYCLRKMGVLTVMGKRQRAWLYALSRS
jgi:hypothetical protein